MTRLPPSPFINESAQSPAGNSFASPAAGMVSPRVPAATLPAVSDELQTDALECAMSARRLDGSPSESLSTDTQHIVEFFSDYAKRRCLDQVSPPLPKVDREVSPDFQSLFELIKDPDDVGDFDDPPVYPLPACLNQHPRNLDLDVMLRKPRPRLLRALLELGGAQ